MANLIEYLPKIMQGYKSCMVAEDKTYFMELAGNELDSNWIGDNSFIIQNLSVDGLGDYPEDCTCFPSGSFDITNKTYTLGIRRAIRFCWDKKEDADTYGVVTATNLMVEFKKKVKDELAKVRYAKTSQYLIAGGRVSAGNTYTTGEELANAISSAIVEINENGGDTSDLICIMSPTNVALLNKGYALGSCCAIDGTGTKVGVNIKMIDGVPIVEDMQTRLRTKVILNTGEADSFGTSVDPTGADINFMLIPRTGAKAIVRYYDEKAFTPETDDCGSNFRLLFDMYHDVLMFDCDVQNSWLDTKPVTPA